MQASLFPFRRRTLSSEARRQIPTTDMLAIRRFILAGDSTFTIVSKASGVRYTFRMRKKLDQDFWFVSYMTGSDNETDFSYCGWVRLDRGALIFGKGRNTPECRRILALQWFFSKALYSSQVLAQIEFWHEGRCGRCGRKLTVPDSIASGFGPECIGYVNKDKDK